MREQVVRQGREATVALRAMLALAALRAGQQHSTRPTILYATALATLRLQLTPGKLEQTVAAPVVRQIAETTSSTTFL
jgi:hypothetical protein